MKTKVQIILLACIFLLLSMFSKNGYFSSLANAAYLQGDSEVIEEEREDEMKYIIPPPKIIIPPRYPNDFYSFIKSLDVIGSHFSYNEFEIYPLSIDRFHIQSRRIINLDDAYARGEIKISEYNDGTVSKVLVNSFSSNYIFIMAGEIISGGMQTRTVVKDILIPPYAKNIILEVYCIEEGRWEGNKEAFSPSRSMLDSNIRKKVFLEREQDEIWSGIREQETRSRQYSDTHNLLEVYETTQKDAGVEKEISLMKRRLPRGSVGMVIVKNGHIVGIEAFFSHEMFSKQFYKLFKSYYYIETSTGYYRRVNINEVRRFIKSLLSSRIVEDRSYAGSGVLYDASYNGFYGTALDFSGILHLSMIN